MLIARRSFLTGLVSSLAAPAIVRATSLMPIRTVWRANGILTIDIITREAVQIFVYSNPFLTNYDAYGDVDFTPLLLKTPWVAPS